MSVGPVWCLNPRPHAQQFGAQQPKQAVAERPFRINENENRCYIRSSLDLAYKSSAVCQFSVIIIQTLKQGHTTTPGAVFSTFREKCEDSLRSMLTSAEKMQKMGPAVYHPIPRRLKRLTVDRCHSKVSSFSPVLSRPWVLVRSEPSMSRTAVRRPTT